MDNRLLLLNMLVLLIVFLTASAKGHPIREDGQSVAPKTPFDVEKYSEYLHHYKCNEIKIKHYYKSMKCDEFETGSIYRFKPGRRPYHNPHYEHLPYFDYPLHHGQAPHHDHPLHHDHAPNHDHHDHHETTTVEKRPVLYTSSERPFSQTTPKSRPSTNKGTAYRPTTAEPPPVSEVQDTTESVSDTMDSASLASRQSSSGTKRRPTLTLTAGGFIEDVDARGRSSGSGTEAPQTRRRRQAEAGDEMEEGAEREEDDTEAENGKEKTKDEDDDEKYVEDDEQEDEEEEHEEDHHKYPKEPSKPNEKKPAPPPMGKRPPVPPPKEKSPPPPPPKEEPPPPPPPKEEPPSHQRQSPRTLNRERRQSYDMDYFEDDYEDGPQSYDHHRSHDGPEKSRDAKGDDSDHHTECTAPLFYGWKHYNWYQILVENGGPPGAYLKGGLKAELKKVEDPCVRPVQQLHTEYKTDFTFKYAKVGKVFRVESVNVRMANTPHEFLDFEGQIIWAPPNVTNRFYQIVYRKDDTGFYVRPVADITCRFRETINRHTDSYDIQLACDLHPEKICYCDKHGHEVCHKVPHDDTDHYESFGHNNQEKHSEGHEHHDEHDRHSYHDNHDSGKQHDHHDEHKHDHDHHEEHKHDHDHHDEHKHDRDYHDDHKHDRDYHEDYKHDRDRHDEHDDHKHEHDHHDQHNDYKHDHDHRDEHDSHDHDHKRDEHDRHGEHEKHNEKYDGHGKRDDGSQDWGCGLYGGRGWCG